MKSRRPPFTGSVRALTVPEARIEARRAGIRHAGGPSGPRASPEIDPPNEELTALVRLIATRVVSRGKPIQIDELTKMLEADAKAAAREASVAKPQPSDAPKKQPGALLHLRGMPHIQPFMSFAEVRASMSGDRPTQTRSQVSEAEPVIWPPAPDPQPYGVSHAGAERLVAEWMRHLGGEDVSVTKLSGDGGIDVISRTHIAQVKNLAGAVPIAQVRELAGVASTDGRSAMMFTSGEYGPSAVTFADQAGMALFRYDAIAARLTACNSAAETIQEAGGDGRFSGVAHALTEDS